MSFFEPVNCNLCGSQEYSVLIQPPKIDHLTREDLLQVYKSSSDEKLLDQLVECKCCQLVYLNPRVKAEIILQSYSEAVDPKFIAQNPLRIRTFSRELKKLTERFDIIPSKDKWVLDIGCAGGAFLKAASDLGFSTVGIEPSAWLCQYGKKEYQLDLRPGILEDYTDSQKNINRSNALLPNSFDIITLWDVIEHLTTPEETMGHVNSLLKDDGLLVINYPDYSSWIAKMMGKHWPFLLSVHLIYFTPKTIKKFLEKCGFEALETSSHWQTLELGYILDRAAKYIGIFKWASKLCSFLKLEKVPFAYYLGQTKVVARKKQLVV